MGDGTEVGRRGWNESVLRGRMDRPGVLCGKEDEKRRRWFPSSWSEYLKRQWCFRQDARGGLSQEIRMITWARI